MTRLLAVDIGNTEIACGRYEDGARRATCRLATANPDFHAELARFLEAEDGATAAPKDLQRDAAIASVVPAATERWREALTTRFGVAARILAALDIPDLSIALSEPETVGIDRLVNAWSARRLLGAPVVVVDMGTATTFDVVDRDGVYRGGAITPGIRLAFKSLAEGTALLPAVEAAPIERAIGRNTVEAIRSGVILGQAEMIRGMVKRFSEELGGAPAIATGGAATLLTPHLEGLFAAVDPFLTLDGIAAIAAGT